MSAFTTLINTVLEILATELRQEEKIKGIQIGKEKNKLSLFKDGTIDGMIHDIERSLNITLKELLELINEFGKVA